MRRRRHAKWGYAMSDIAQVTSTEGNPTADGLWIVPPGWVNFELNATHRSSLVYKGSLVWANYVVSNPTGAQLPMGDATFAIYKTVWEDNSAFNDGWIQPFAEPELPSSITNWDSEDAATGCDPFLWRHQVFNSESPQSSFGAGGEIGGGATAGYPDCYKQSVKVAWAPDFRIRSARKMVRNEGIRASFKPVNGLLNGMVYTWTVGAVSLFR